ncbi:hypothetical protein MNBD_PLANCTO02-1607, partial [hydrothermal vent metagenome]
GTCESRIGLVGCCVQLEDISGTSFASWFSDNWKPGRSRTCSARQCTEQHLTCTTRHPSQEFLRLGVRGKPPPKQNMINKTTSPDASGCCCSFDKTQHDSGTVRLGRAMCEFSQKKSKSFENANSVLIMRNVLNPHDIINSVLNLPLFRLANVDEVRIK